MTTLIDTQVKVDFLRREIRLTMEEHQVTEEGPHKDFQERKLKVMARNLGQEIGLVKENPTEPKSIYQLETERNVQKWMLAHHLAANEVMFATSAPVRTGDHEWLA